MAFEGKGAYRNGERIHYFKNHFFDEAVVGIGSKRLQNKINVPTFTALMENIKHTRHWGPTPLKSAQVAAGLTDAFIDLRNKIRTTDVAAGFLIVKEAGGIVTDQENKPINVKLDPKQTLSFVASANMEIHQKILSLVKL